MEPICQQKFNAQQLVTRFPAKLSDRNKNTVFGMSSPPGAVHAGTISFSRWRLMPLPETFGRGEGSPSFELREKNSLTTHQPRTGSIGISISPITIYFSPTAAPCSLKTRCRLPSTRHWRH